MKIKKNSILFPKLFHQKHLLFGYFITYFTVMIIPFLLGSLYYHQTTRLVYDDTVNMNASVLHHTAAITDIRFEEINQFAERLIINPEVCAFQVAVSPFEYPNTYQMIELCEMLSANYSTNQMIDNYFLFFHRNRACITGKYAYPYEQFYEIYYQDTGLSYDEWLNDLSEKGRKGGYLLTQLPVQGNKETCLTYAKPLLSAGGNAGFLLIVINTDLLSDLFSAIDISDGGALYIQDIDGNILYSDTTGNIPIDELQQIISLSREKDEIVVDEPSSYELSIDGQKMLVTSTTTSATRYTYVFVQRANSITERVDSLKFLMIAILFLSFIIGTFLCYLMSQKSSRPLNAILGDLPPSEGEDNFETAFERIHASWYDMVSHNRTIEAALSRQLPYLQYTFLSRLLRRDFSTAKEAENLADYIHFEYKKKLHTILVFRICPDIFPTQQMDLPFYMACRMAVKEALLLLRPYVLSTEWGTDQIVCLYTTDISQAESIPEQIPHLVQELSHTLPTGICDRLCLYVGTTVSSLHEVARSFENCQAMFQARPAAANAPFSILWYHEESARPSSYFYPYEVRSNIIQYALSGDEAQLHDALHQLLNHNIVESALPPLLFALFLNDLESTLFAILTRLELPQETYQEVYQELEMFSHLDDLQKMHRICDLFKQLCLLASQRNAAQESHFMDSSQPISESIMFLLTYHWWGWLIIFTLMKAICRSASSSIPIRISQPIWRHYAWNEQKFCCILRTRLSLKSLRIADIILPIPSAALSNVSGDIRRLNAVMVRFLLLLAEFSIHI